VRNILRYQVTGVLICAPPATYLAFEHLAFLGYVTDIPARRVPTLLVTLRSFAHYPFEQYAVGYVVDTSVL
jgi:hypothetical protein